MGGDLLKQDGTGNQTIYDDGQTGSQFFITLREMPGLNGSQNTIFGRVLLGEKTVH